MKAVRLDEFGGPEVLQLSEIDEPRPEPGEILIDLVAAGVNRADILLRKGAYHVATLPAIPGWEGSGTVAAVGEGVRRFRVGDRVVAFGGRLGFYAERAAVPEAQAAKIPEGISFEDAASIPVVWLTAWYSLVHLAKVKERETVLVTAAASGVGQAAIQIAKHFGARVIAAAGGPEKLAWAKELGADDSIDYLMPDWEREVLSKTDGKGVEVVIEAVGGRVFAAALKALGYAGRLVAFANVNLEDSTINTRNFYPKNAVIYGFQIAFRIERQGYRPTEDLEDILRLVATGKFRTNVDKVFSLAEAPAAHRYLEERKNRGKVVLRIKNR